MIKNKVFLCLFFLIFLLNHAGAVTFKFGKSGRIDYNLKSGTFNVFQDTEAFLKNGFSSFKEKDHVYNSKDYTNRKYSSQYLSDALGKGLKHVIELTGAGMPTMKQVFYTYEALPYFLCEIEISGVGLSSNEMIPLQGAFPLFGNENEIRSVFVPFDNDTFIRYNARQLRKNEGQTSAEVGVVYHTLSAKGLVSGSLNHRNWKTGVMTGLDIPGQASISVKAGFTEKSITRDDLPHGALTGNVIKSPMIFYGLFKDWRLGMELYAKANRLVEPPIVFPWKDATPMTWNSWGVMQEKISYDKIISVTDFFADSLKTFRSEGTLFIDLDSYWDNMLKGGLEGDYSKLKEFAGYVKKRGMKPGIYWAPFTDWGFGSGPSRRAEGGNYTFGELWTKVGKGYNDIDGARALDPTHPGTQQRIALVIGKFKECGFEMIKIDFLGHASVESDHFYDPKVSTGMQAYEQGMSFLLKQLDGKMLVYAAISPTMASGRYIHTRRIACDAFKSIDDAKYTLNSVTYGWWQTYLYDYIDADHVVLGTENLGVNKIRTLSAIVTGTITVGDDFSAKGQWTDRAKILFGNQQLLEVIKDGKAFRPLDQDKEVSEMFTKLGKGFSYLALFNYGQEEKTYQVTAASLGLKSFNGCKITDVFSNKSMAIPDQNNFVVAPGNALLVKITP